MRTERPSGSHRKSGHRGPGPLEEYSKFGIEDSGGPKDAPLRAQQRGGGFQEVAREFCDPTGGAEGNALTVQRACRMPAHLKCTEAFALEFLQLL